MRRAVPWPDGCLPRLMRCAMAVAVQVFTSLAVAVMEPVTAVPDAPCHGRAGGGCLPHLVRRAVACQCWWR